MAKHQKWRQNQRNKFGGLCWVFGGLCCVGRVGFGG